MYQYNWFNVLLPLSWIGSARVYFIRRILVSIVELNQTIAFSCQTKTVVITGSWSFLLKNTITNLEANPLDILVKFYTNSSTSTSFTCIYILQLAFMWTICKRRINVLLVAGEIPNRSVISTSHVYTIYIIKCIWCLHFIWILLEIHTTR